MVQIAAAQFAADTTTAKWLQARLAELQAARPKAPVGGEWVREETPPSSHRESEQLTAKPEPVATSGLKGGAKRVWHVLMHGPSSLLPP